MTSRYAGIKNILDSKNRIQYNFSGKKEVIININYVITKMFPAKCLKYFFRILIAKRIKVCPALIQATPFLITCLHGVKH